MGVKSLGRPKAVSPNKLKVSPYNIRKDVNEEALKELITSVAGTGQILNPISVDENNEIVAGQRRWLAAKALNMNIDVIYKEYDSMIDKIVESFNENVQRRDVSTKDCGRAVAILHNEHNLTFEQIEKLTGVSHSTLHTWYKQITGPTAFMEHQAKLAIEKEKALEEERLAKKKKSGEGSVDLDKKNIEKLEELNRRSKALADAKHLWTTMGLRKGNVVSRIIDSPRYRNDVFKILGFVNFAINAPLHTLEDIAKDVSRDLPVNIEDRQRILDSDSVFKTIRVPKALMEKIEPIMKRRNIDWFVVAVSALTDWVDTWELPEDWEESVDRITPEVFK